MKRREFLTRSLGFATGAVGLVAAGPDGRAMASPAQGHRILDLELFDTARQRLVPVRLYLPQQASAESPVPLVVFSHGLGGSRMGYSYLARHWADAGMASLHPQHVGSDSRVWQGNPLELLQRLQAAARESEALARVRDVRFALDQILAYEQAPLIDAKKIAVAGHSYGANTAMLVAGARVNAGSAYAGELGDRRIQAAILISAPPLLGQGPAQEVLSSVSVPTMHVTSLEDTINLPGYRSTVEDRIAIFDAMAKSPRTLAVYNTGGHSIFTDRTTRSGPEISARIKGATQELCTLFLRRSLYFGYPPVNTESMSAQPAMRTNPAAPADAYEVQQGLSQWAYRHKDLLDRFTRRET
ncbi:MAG: alpha/beta hydrolase family protein [Betaproteobacteria bacterium]